MTDTALFNIGGHRCVVSRSLLSQFPNSMLAASASKQWQEDPETEIFIERDGQLFRFVLRYMRDGKVTLPVTEPKEALISELEYYGIDCDESKVSDTTARRTGCLNSFSGAMNDLRHKVNRDHLEYRCTRLALDIVSAYISEFADQQVTQHKLMKPFDPAAVTIPFQPAPQPTHRQNGKSEVELSLYHIQQRENRFELHKVASTTTILKIVNEQLCPLGLKVSRLLEMKTLNNNNIFGNSENIYVELVEPK